MTRRICKVKGKKIMAAFMLSSIVMMTAVGCETVSEDKTEATTEVTTEATTAKKEKEEIPQKVSDGVYEEEHHYSITLPEGKWEKTGSIEKGTTVFTSNKGEVIKVFYYEGKDSTKQRKKLPTSEEKMKEQFTSKTDSSMAFERVVVGGADDAIIRMYYAKKNFKKDAKYTAHYVISGADATYIAKGTTKSKKEESYNRLQECVRSMDLAYSFD